MDILQIQTEEPIGWCGIGMMKGSDFPIGLAAPARRALTSAGIQRLEHLTKFSEDEVKQLHGIGPNALAQLRHALGAKGLSFADGKKKKG